MENKSPENIGRLFDFLIRLPYQSEEEREELRLRKFVRMMKAARKT